MTDSGQGETQSLPVGDSSLWTDRRQQRKSCPLSDLENVISQRAGDSGPGRLVCQNN